MNNRKLFGALVALTTLSCAPSAFAQVDPGVRGGAAGAGHPLPGLTANEQIFFDVGQDDFNEAEGVGDGLGPRFNLDGCGGCHFQPGIGGTAGTVNPQFAIATAFGRYNLRDTGSHGNGGGQRKDKQDEHEYFQWHADTHHENIVAR